MWYPMITWLISAQEKNENWPKWRHLRLHKFQIGSKIEDKEKGQQKQREQHYGTFFLANFRCTCLSWIQRIFKFFIYMISRIFEYSRDPTWLWKIVEILGIQPKYEISKIFGPYINTWPSGPESPRTVLTRVNEPPGRWMVRFLPVGIGTE